MADDRLLCPCFPSMTSSADMVRRRRRKLIRSIHNKGESKLFVPDDVVLEILVRLPHAKHVIRCSLVSKRWQSLLRHAQFVPEFSRHNLRRIEDNNFDLFFRIGGDWPEGPNSVSVYYRLYREKQSETNYSLYPNMVSKLQWPDIKLRSSSLDLMVFRNYGMNEIHLNNPLTGQWLKINGPDPCLKTWSSTGLVADLKNFGQYKVVVVEEEAPDDSFLDDYKLDIHVFCSRTGFWTLSKFTLPYREFHISEEYEIKSAISSQGIVYFPLTVEDRIIGVLVCSVLESTRVRYVATPVEGFDPRGRFTCTRVFFGVVLGRLRVSQLLKRQKVFSLKIWELRDDDDDYSWVLVHDASLVSGNKDKTRLFMVAFHPYNGDVVFMLRECKYICRYHSIRGDEYEIVGQLPICDLLPSSAKTYYVSPCIKAFTVVHTLWPTPLRHITRPLPLYKRLP